VQDLGEPRKEDEAKGGGEEIRKGSTFYSRILFKGHKNKWSKKPNEKGEHFAIKHGWPPKEES